MMGMEKGDVLGHEPMGIVGEVGSSVAKLEKGDRVVVPFVIACGRCFFCKGSSIHADTTTSMATKMVTTKFQRFLTRVRKLPCSLAITGHRTLLRKAVVVQKRIGAHKI